VVLIAAARREAPKNLLDEEGARRDARFWKLAQSLTALYLLGADEDR
jgi:hypothetical protein